MTESTESRSRRILLVVSEAPGLPPRLRSGTREIRSWVGDAPRNSHEFSGDPTDPATYEWTRGARAVTAVIDVQSAERARAALHAVRSARPDAAVLLLTDEAADVDGRSDGTLARGGDVRDVLRLDLDEELERLEAERRVFCLRAFIEGHDVVPILIHNDPDPDAVSSALAVATLLGGSADRTPIVTLEEIRRPENRRMTELLRIRVTRITAEELRKFERVITVDTQPRGLQQDGRPRFAVIDHHPVEKDWEAEYSDVRPEYGATATMMTEYLRAVEPHRIGRGLATALLFGIRTDTDTLTRKVTAADVAAYAFLQEAADMQLVQRFERPSYTEEAARAFGSALAGAACEDDTCVVDLGEIDSDDSHMLADLADFCLAIENVTWAAAAARVDGELVVTLRHAGAGEPGAGDVARELARGGGSGGGHATMARVALPAEAAEELLAERDGDVAGAVLALLRRTVASVQNTSRPDSHPAPQASAP